MKKENLEVQEFSLKRIVENLKEIPRNGAFDDEIKKLTPEEKKKLMDMVSKFNEYGQVLRCEQALMEISKTIEEVTKMAGTYAMTESSDWFQSKVVERDFKQIGKTAKDFKNLAQEAYGKIQQLNALYEDMGHVLGRYYEIQSLEEMNDKWIDSDKPFQKLDPSVVTASFGEAGPTAPVDQQTTLQ